MKLKLDFFFTDLSQHSRIYLVFFYSWAWVKRWYRVICVVKLKVIHPQPKYKTKNFPNLRKNLIRDITWDQKQIQISKCYLVRVQVPWAQLNSLFFLIQKWPCNNNIVADKGSNIFDECPAECVHLYPQEEECTTSSWGDSKIYLPGTIANSQRCWQKWCCSQSKNFSGTRYTIRHLKTSRVISVE